MTTSPRKRDETLTVLLIRHADDAKRPERLTELGIEQSKLTAIYLKQLEIDALFSSSALRAKTTAQYFAKALGKKIKTLRLFESMLPAPLKIYKDDFDFKKMSKKDRAQLNLFIRQSQERADSAFQYLVTQRQRIRGKTTIAVVAHGNIIRYWMCCALGISRKKWVLMESAHCSITTLRVNPKGQVMLIGFSEVGHLPRGKRSNS